MKWAITDKFSDYLYGKQFSVYTDNNPLTYVLTTAKLDATGHRWVAELANYNFSINYKTGKSNIDADALSRMEYPQDMHNIDVHSVSAILNKPDVCLIETISMSQDVQLHIEDTPVLPIEKTQTPTRRPCLERSYTSDEK